MPSRSNRAFSLIEVIITVAILSTAIVIIMQGFGAMILSARLSQSKTLAGLLAEEKAWQIEQTADVPVTGSVVIQDREFAWSYNKATDPSVPGIDRLDLSINWQERRSKKENLDISTYLAAK